MKFFLSLILGLFITVGALGGPLDSQDAATIDKNTLVQMVTSAVETTLSEKIEQARASGKVVGPDQELAVLLDDLQALPPDSQKYAAYFTFYNFRDNPEKIKEGYIGLTMWIHSLSNLNLIRLPVLVENGNGTLFRVDIRDYGWSLQSWENVSRADPYFREPWINHELYNSIRLISGNVLVRGDWFIDATSTPVKQIDTDQKNVLYYELIYGDKIPKNKQEFYDFWRFDVKKIEGQDGKPSLVQQILVKAGTSGVARHNRVLARAPTELGYMWETSDFKNSSGARNVVNNLYPGVMNHPESDAGELITSDLLGLQKYFVVDKAGKRLDIADPGIARDKDNEDVRVMTGRSCVECHAGGINSAINNLKEEIMVSNKLKYADYTFALKADGAYFRTMLDLKTKERKYETEYLIAKDQERYNQSVFNIVGLTAPQNGILFKKILNNYNQNVTLEMAAAECGVTVPEFQEKVRASINGQLNALAVDGATITREEWEYPNNGAYQQAMMLIWGVGKTLNQTYGNISTEKELTAPLDEVKSIRVLAEPANLKVGKNVIAQIPPDTVLDVLEFRDKVWYKVHYNNKIGYVHAKQVQVFSDKIR
jgi:hypothetical protein